MGNTSRCEKATLSMECVTLLQEMSAPDKSDENERRNGERRKPTGERGNLRGREADVVSEARCAVEQLPTSDKSDENRREKRAIGDPKPSAGPRSHQRPMNRTKTRGGTEKGSELMGESRATDEIAFRVLAMRGGRRGLSLIEEIAFLHSMPAPRSAGSMEPPEVLQKSGI